jgi:hypothetical protein
MTNKLKNYKTVQEFYKKDGDNTLKNGSFDFTQLTTDYNNISIDKQALNTLTKKTILTNTYTPKNNGQELNIKYELTEGNGTSPDVFGPPFWFTLHNGASKYPDDPSKIVQAKMKNFIIAIPIMLPCLKCKDHATSYIETNLEKLDDIVSSRNKLFNFFVDFHNYVNKRYGKNILTYQQAEQLYNGSVKITKMSYS